MSKMTEMDSRYIAFENDHTYLKTTTNNGPGTIQSSKTKIFSNRTPINLDNKKLISRKRSSLVPILPKITSFKDILSTFPTQLNDVFFVPSTNTTNAPLRINSQNIVHEKSQKNHKSSQQIVPQEHIVKVIKPIKNNLTKDYDNQIRTIKLSSNLLKRIQSGEKLFMCMECDEVYTEHKDLLNHQIIHDKYNRNVVDKKKEKNETLFNKSSVEAVENENIINSHKNIVKNKMPEPIFKFSGSHPANPKKRKVVFQGECIMCHSVFQDLGKHLKTVHKSDLYKNKVNNLEFCCRKCNMEFEIQSQLLAHDLSAHRHTYSYTCEHCFKDFSFRDDLETHIEIHHTSTIKYLCPYCDVGFSHSIGLRTHLTKHIGYNGIENTANELTASQIECSPKRPPEKLNQIFSELNHISLDDREIYVEEVKNNYQVRFSKDDNKSADISSLTLNSDINKDSTIDVDLNKEKYVGNDRVICNQEQKSLNRHRISYTVCRICMAIVSYSRIGKHMKKKHNDAAPYQCEICHAEFNRKHIMDDHRRKHTNDKPHKCNECSKCFTYKHHLNRHKMLLHNTDPLKKPFTCSVCDKAFSFKEYLTLHVNSRHKGKHFMCQVCGKSFSTNAALTKHQLSHTDERPFMCEHCGRTFKCKTHCETHTKNLHTGDPQLALPPEKFECDLCNKKFSTKVYRDMHYKRHNGEGHQCDICFKLFVSKAHLQRHVKIMHQN